ncbi:hypothetical protein MUP79_08345 [Candidatus Bathyarchaeota archaeon]|nr:hypothetical protein [Candidatus Bathyarchaeota archaeon]
MERRVAITLLLVGFVAVSIASLTVQYRNPTQPSETPIGASMTPTFGFLIPETEMPQPYFLKYGQLPAFKDAAEELAWLGMLTKLGAQVSGPDVSFPFWGTLVVSHGVGADGYYWIWVERGKVSEVNSSVVATIVEFVNRPAKEIGFMTEVPVKFAEATGSGGVDAASTDS